MIDEGYDISDYENINPIFGTLKDAEQLIKECHSRGLRIIFDLVINHTSDQHKWFLESRSSKENPKRDWYIWRPARYDEQGNRQPPTNWESAFSQSTWEWDEHTQEYYLHMFAVEQPDLNWRNTECRNTLLQSSMEFWLKRGLDGFRVDTCSLYSKPNEYVDAPITKPGFLQSAWDLIVDGEHIHEYLGLMGKLLAKYDAMTVGELSRLPNKEVLKYISFARNELSMVFAPDVGLIGMNYDQHFQTEPWNVAQIANNTNKLQTLFDDNDGWTTSFLENHDLGRSVSRFANDSEKYHKNASKMLSLYTILLSGTPFIYQGQEIGMTNVPLSWNLSEYLDIATINFIKSLRESGKSEEEIEKIKPNINLLARDNSRTPVQWTDGPNAGFTAKGIKPWMRVNDNYTTINVASQIDDTDSILQFYRKAIHLRKEYPSLFVYGKYSNVFEYGDSDTKNEEKVFAFAKDVRSNTTTSDQGQKRAIVLLNFSDQRKTVNIAGLENGKVALSSHEEVHPADPLQPFEGRVVLL